MSKTVSTLQKLTLSRAQEGTKEKGSEVPSSDREYKKVKPERGLADEQKDPKENKSMANGDSP